MGYWKDKITEQETEENLIALGESVRKTLEEDS